MERVKENIKSVKQRVRENWSEYGWCTSCSHHAMLSEHDYFDELDESDLEEALKDGYVTFICQSDENAETSDHRRIRVYLNE